MVKTNRIAGLFVALIGLTNALPAFAWEERHSGFACYVVGMYSLELG